MSKWKGIAMYQDPMVEQEREGRLPVYAQQLIADLRRLVERAQKEAREAALETDPHGSVVVINRHAGMPHGPELPIGLGDETVTFRLGDGHAIDARVEPGRLGRNSRLRLTGNGELADSLLVRPVSNNVVEAWTFRS